MNRCKLMIVLFFATNSTIGFTTETEHSGFDEVCAIYTEVQNSSISTSEKSDYIFKNIKKRIHSKDALQAHSAVFNLEAKKRYSIFRESAEYSLKKNWNCNAMEQLMK